MLSARREILFLRRARFLARLLGFFAGRECSYGRRLTPLLRRAYVFPRRAALFLRPACFLARRASFLGRRVAFFTRRADS